MRTYKTIEHFNGQIPEGATHYTNESSEASFAFYKLSGGFVYVMLVDVCSTWNRTGFTALDEIGNLIELTLVHQPRWSGEGFPSAGTECEVSFSDANVWDKCLVTYFGTSLCVVDFGDCERSFGISSVKFRPLETPEQKKEREELEAAYDLYKTRFEGDYIGYTFDEFKIQSMSEAWIRVVRKTNYKIK